MFNVGVITSFQSIGVTKEWRLYSQIAEDYRTAAAFPINRRHQRMATGFAEESVQVTPAVSNQ